MLVPTHNALVVQIFIMSTLTINRDPTVWGEDSERFDPERWLDPSRLPPADTTTSGFAGMYSFLEGPRMCIGYRLGASTPSSGFFPTASSLVLP